MKFVDGVVSFIAIIPQRSIYCSSKQLRMRAPFYNPFKKATDPAKQDFEYYEKAARALPLDDHYIDALKILYDDKIAYERDLRYKAEDNLVGKSATEWLPKVDLSAPKLGYDEVDALASASEAVKRIFSLEYGTRRDLSAAWKKALIDQTRKHSLDNASLEMKIAWLTGLIRHWSLLVKEINDKPRKPKWLYKKIKEAMDYRRKLLRLLRETDSAAFEKTLKDLKIAYQIPVLPEDTVEKRRKAWVEAQLTERVEKEKEARLTKLYEKFTKDIDKFNKETEDKLSKLEEEKREITKRLAGIAELRKEMDGKMIPKYQPHVIGFLPELTRHIELFYHHPLVAKEKKISETF